LDNLRRKEPFSERFEAGYEHDGKLDAEEDLYFDESGVRQGTRIEYENGRKIRTLHWQGYNDRRFIEDEPEPILKRIRSFFY
jgi:hypothetical protein